MNPRLFVLAAALLLAALAASAATINATSCSYADVSSAVSSASSGDTVLVPDGNCTWSSTLTITKGITLQGAGSNNTIITGNLSSSTRGLLEYNPPAATNKSFRLTGFTLDSNETGIAVRIMGPVTSLAIVENVIVNNNSLKGKIALTAVEIQGTVYGVFSNNIITGGISNEQGAQWYSFSGLPSNYGGSDNIYFEDNTITTNRAVVFTAGHGSRYVARYNTINNATRGILSFDVHGNMNGPSYTNMVFEGYGNYTNNTGYDGQLGFIHGSKNLLFYNKVANSTATRIQVLEYFNDDLYYYGLLASATENTFTFVSPTIPMDAAGKMSVRIVDGTGIGQIRAITGRTNYYTATVDSNWNMPLDTTSKAAIYYTSGERSGLLQHVNNSYFWNNRRSNGSLINAYISIDDWYTPTVHNYPAVLLENREFWQQGTSFDGSVGVGCGTLTSRPTNCTTGVGYWATNQSCSDLTGMVGANPSTPISGTLYKCTSTNTWAPYYTPYTYPHPLTLEGPTCGNNVKEEGETCDGTDLGGQTCQLQGYDSGDLACKSDCSGYDTNGCSIDAASCSQADVQDAINSAVDGDTVMVPAGSCTITTPIAVTNKNITIKGAGIDITILTANITSGTRPGVFKVTTKPVRITGFTFNGTGPTYGAHLVFDSTGDETALFRVYGNKFTVDSGYAILTWGLSYGLIDSSAFITTVDHSFIHIYADNRNSWGRALSLGTNKAVYIEDNTFTNSALTGNYRTITADGGARYVFRYNTVINQGIDSHGYCGNGLAGTMSFEIYNNTWSLAVGKNIFRWMFLRGGTGVVYNNVMTNNGTIYREIDMTEYRLGGVNSCTGAAKTCCTSYPCLDQIGRGTNQALDPAYFWNNTVNGAAATVSVNPVIDIAWIASKAYSLNYYVVPIVSNGYYYSATIGGTSGSSEPSWPATIGNTIGDNNITWTNMCQILDVNNVIQINRDYYAGMAKPGYTPYTYPHPLRAEGPQPPTCNDNDGDGYGAGCSAGSDCNDSNASVHSNISCSFNGASCGSYNLCTLNCPQTPPENCSNSADDDCDSLVDCLDSSCSAYSACASCPKGQIKCNNSCIAPACVSDANCFDSNSSTNDFCLNGGTCTATCTNTPITQPICSDGQSMECTTPDGCEGTRICSQGTWSSCEKLDPSCPQIVGPADSDADGVASDKDCNDTDTAIGLCTGCAVCSNEKCVAGSCPSTSCSEKSGCRGENYYSYLQSVQNECTLQGGLGTCTAKKCIPQITLNDSRCGIPGQVVLPPEFPGQITEEPPQIQEIFPVQVLAAAIALVAIAAIAIAWVLKNK